MNTPNGWSLSNMMQYFDTEFENEHQKHLVWLVLISAQNKDNNLIPTKRWWK